MQLAADDVRKAHERLGRPDEIVHQRRTLYTAAIDLCSGERGEQSGMGDDVLDNPAVRGHLGAVLSGRSSYSPSHLRPLAELVAPGFTTELEGCPVRLASTPDAPQILVGALRRVARELDRHVDSSSTLDLLTTDAGRELEEAYGHLLAGVRLAARCAPELALDLLPHVGLFAVVVAPDAARLGSASAREFPGLILIPVPLTALEVAEALIHEGAHQKFFDFGMTRAILGAHSQQAPRFTPSWAPSGAPEWPLEQSLAAWHAYCCLAVFARSLGDSSEAVLMHSDSLLPKAPARSAEIGEWIREQGRFLGPDAHSLIEALEGAPPRDDWPQEDAAAPVLDSDAEGGSLLVRPAGNRTLVARRGTPPSLFWVNSTPVLR
jgi:hypothetical protein